ncbi:MAG: DUF6438 domain-containing protein [Saprospiraceae bacterium]|nr:DUF6438 domain-containing protein [Saprospiraceae bacterium]
MRSGLYFCLALALITGCDRKVATSLEASTVDSLDSTVTKESTYGNRGDTLIVDSLIENTQQPDTVIFYSRSGCFGHCPVYSFLLKDNREIKYSGRAHVSQIDTFTRTISQEDLTAWIDFLDNASLDQYEGQYPPNEQEWVVDLPTSNIIWEDDSGFRKIIRINHSPPEALRTFENNLRQRIDNLDWQTGQD